MESEHLALLYGPVLCGLALAVFANHLLSVVYRKRPMEAQIWDFENRRLIQMREQFLLFRFFEPFVNEIAVVLESGFGKRLLGMFRLRQSVTVSIERLGTSIPCTAYEYLALGMFQAIVLGVFGLLLLSQSMSSVRIAVIVPTLILLAFYSHVNRINVRAKQRLAKFKKRLPFSVDLMALMMDAGATFMESLATMVVENNDNPVGEEFGDLERKVLSGQTMSSGLEEMRARMRDPSIDEIVFSIVNSEKLGTPKSKTLLRLASQMRTKKSQEVEKAIGQAQTMMTFPGFIIMLACLLIVAAPFGLAALQQIPW